MKKKKNAILVLSGHTGGHLFPAMSFAEAFKAAHPNWALVLVTSNKAQGILARFEHSFINRVFFLQPFPAPSTYGMLSVAFVTSLLLAFFKTLLILVKERPKMTVGFGSYVSFPGIVLSRCLNIPTLIHEQNVRPGKATEQCLRFAHKIAESFPGSIQSYPEKIVTTGLPLRSMILKSKRTGNVTADLVSLLILGGSQGSKSLNRHVLTALSQLTSEEKKILVVNHLTGYQDAEWVKKEYDILKIDASVHPFFDKMNQLFEQCHFAITRAGANTLFELAYYGIPAIAIPYPFASAHQNDNAKYFSDKKAIFYREENQITTEWLVKSIQLLICDESCRRSMGGQMAHLAIADAHKRLVQTAEQLLESFR